LENLTVKDLSIQGILPFLEETIFADSVENFAQKIKVYPSLDSTNLTAKEMILSGVGEHGAVIIADGQTDGRGRHGRSFFSPPGHGLYMSFILNPDMLGFDSPALTTIFTANVVCEAIEAVCGKPPQIKWVNDLFLNGKKICGISAEMVMDSENNMLKWLIIGIGINVILLIPSELPVELQSIVGAIFEHSEEMPSINIRNQLAAWLISRLPYLTHKKEDILFQYKQRLFVIGKQVQVMAKEPYEATALNIDDNGHLLVRDRQGILHVLSAGEISVRA